MRPAPGPGRTRLSPSERLPALSEPLTGDPAVIGRDVALDLLRTGRIEVQGRLVDASNATLFCSLTGDGVEASCVYKPVAGEKPLWDFPDGTLAGREVSAYLVSEAIGWDVVPPTVLREGPFGTGMVQLWIDGDESVDLAQLIRRNLPELRRMAVFDAVINNADRKGGHLIPMPDGRVYGVDHGVAFSTEDKLRTVLWRWAGKPLTEEATEALQRVATDGEALAGSLAEHLTRREVRRTLRRIDRLLLNGKHPEPSGDWPAIPWPPF